MIRRACALAGLLGLFLQGSSGGHMLLVEHTRCAEHGELVHGGEAHHHVGAAHDESDFRAFQTGSDGASGEAHQHCALIADRRDALVSIGNAQSAPLAASTVQSLVAEQGLVAAETQRFRIAPKNSPPA
jgi:hypothetical protein